jgi:hypothetical protein
MPLKIAWLDPVLDLFEEQLTQKEKDQAYNWLEIIATWPDCCPLRRRGRYRAQRRPPPRVCGSCGDDTEGEAVATQEAER